MAEPPKHVTRVAVQDLCRVVEVWQVDSTAIVVPVLAAQRVRDLFGAPTLIEVSVH